MSVKLPVQFVKKTNENQSIIRFVCMDALQNWWKTVFLLVSDTKVGKFLSFQDISWSVKNTKGQDVGMRFTAKISNVWAQTRRNHGPIATHWAHNKDWSEWADAKADPSLRWTYRSFFLLLSCCGSFIIVWFVSLASTIFKELISFFWSLSKCKLHWVACKVNVPWKGSCKLC